MIKIDSASLEYVLKVTPPEQNIMLVGRHGIGKSKILESYFTEQGFKVITLFLGQMSDPGDLIGLPEKDDDTGRTEFILPYWFPVNDEPVVLFLDEMNRARPEVLQTIMDLTLNRTLAGKKLPEGSRIISAVNDGDAYTLTELDPALVSRFNVYEFQPTVQEWLVWAAKNNIDKRIIDFISENHNFLDGNDLDKSVIGLERTADRRSWERLSNVLKNMTEIGQLQLNVIAGIVGMAAAARFYTSIAEHRVLNAEELLTTNNFVSLINPKLSAYSVPELAILNESIYRYLETEPYSKNEEEKILFNLNEYFNALKRLESKEPLAHFANIFSSANYSHAVITIATKCTQTVYQGLRDFISEIGQ